MKKNVQALADMSDEEFLIFVSRDTSEMSKIVWNRAIEAVIKLINDDKYYDTLACVMEDEIRSLKK